MKTFSLTRRLIGAVLFAEFCSVVLLVAGAGAYDAYTHLRAFDILLRGRADSMLGAVQDAEDQQDNVMLDGTQTSVPRRDIYAVRDEHGNLLGHSSNWASPDAAFENRREFNTVKVDGRPYRVIRLDGTRVVDPGDKNGGITRHVVILYGAPTHPVWDAIERAISFYALLGFCLLVATGLIMLKILGHGLQPLHELASQAAAISVDSWEFAPSARVRSIRELAPLGSALEDALTRLERSFSQQRQFVSDAAHELKTSVAVVKSSLQVLTMRSRTAEEYKAGLERAELDCRRMEELVASMLMLAAVEFGGGRGDETPKRVDLNGILSTVVEEFGTTAEVFGIRFKVSCSGFLPVQGSTEEVRVLCSNLVRNALQHSAHGGEVRIFTDTREGSAELHIEDDGEGISPEVLPRVFERFYRGDASRSRRTGGTGLGLSISKAIVEGMDGGILIESELGHGTRVIVTLPVAIV